MAEKRYRIGFIGCGSTANFFLKGWDYWKDRVEIAALCDVAPEQLAAKKEKWPELCGDAATFADFREMLARADLDIVCICTCGDQHLEQTQACLEASKHIFLEKPVGYSLEEARQFQHLAHAHADLKVGVAFSLRYHRAFIDMKALLESGELGEILTGEISYSHPKIGKKRKEATTGDAEGQLVRDSDIAGGDSSFERSAHHPGFTDRGGNYVASSTLTHSTHPWDMARYLFGEVHEAFCAQSTNALGFGNGAQMGMLWMRSGALVHVLSGLTRVPNVGGNQHQFVQAHGTKGSAWLVRDMYEPYERHTFYRTDGDIQTAPLISDLPDSSHGVVLRSKNLMDAIEGKAKLMCSMEDAAKTTELLYAVRLSEHMQTKVQVLPGCRTG